MNEIIIGIRNWVETRKKNKKERQLKSVIRWVLFTFIIFLSLAVLIGLYLVEYNARNPLSDAIDEEEAVFAVKEGQSLRQIALGLERANIIKDDIWFVMYVYYMGWTSKMQAGDYSLAPSMAIDQIAEKMAYGAVIDDSVTVMFPPGFTLKQLDTRLTNLELIEEGELMAMSELEGYLFPDTYKFDKIAKLEDIIEKMRNNFYKQIDEEMMEEIGNQERTLHEIITMASIIEKEVAIYNDKRIVSGIFWQRINDNYPLQSCATLGYALGENKWRYSILDTQIDSPYNTYKNVGLPPGPINNPGYWSLKAAIYPIWTDYYFFLSKPTGETVFSRTGAEHEANKAEYLD